MDTRERALRAIVYLGKTVACGFFLWCSFSFQAVGVQSAIEYNRDIRPILAENCFSCHGPDGKQRRADLRLDVRESALKAKAIVPGKASESSLVERILTEDPEDLMPPRKSHKTLSASQKEMLQRWIDEGANYQLHWAFSPIIKNNSKSSSHSAGQLPINPIDLQIQQRQSFLELKHAPEADKISILRRLYFDLTGLPPPRAVAEQFLNNQNPEAYDMLVTQLLSSPNFGERMAIWWLDLVRYGDSEGYYADRPVDLWAYRNYVIDSFNSNKSFDQFTLEQIAGDYISQTDTAAVLGSAFNRLILTTGETGAQKKDYQARYMADRVRAVGTVWLGITLECAQCHDHKFDPITIKDFYSLGAFFADIEDYFLAYDRGILLAPPEMLAEAQRLQRKMLESKRWLESEQALIRASVRHWENSIKEGRRRIEELDSGAILSESEKYEAEEVLDIIRTQEADRSEGDAKKVENYFLSRVSKEYQSKKKEADAAEKAFQSEYERLPKCLVSNHAAPPRQVRVLPRGNWMDESGEVVDPSFPHFLSPDQSGSNGRLNRLDLAKWLVSSENPLTARVFINRLWAQFFGEGLHNNLQDFGIQGGTPNNTDLLDWLAAEFVESGWDVKHMVKLIVTSQVYRQASARVVDSNDPDNRELTRQVPLRFPAELIRDNALALSGLLNNKIGGPSFKPYQPDYYWDILDQPKRTYEPESDSNQYRRGLYIWRQRTAPHPFLSAFDAPSRDACVAERARSNIPQQALVLLNDPSFLEAARAFGVRIILEGGSGPESRIEWAWKEALLREPRTDEKEIALSLYKKHRDDFRAKPEDASTFLKTGYYASPIGVETEELAAWTNVARLIFNLHESITRP